MIDGFFFDYAVDDEYPSDDSCARDNLSEQENDPIHEFDMTDIEEEEDMLHYEANELPHYSPNDTLQNDTLHHSSLEDTSRDLNMSIPATIAMAGIIAESLDDERNTYISEKESTEIVERISLREASASASSKRENLPLRPFEQYVQDLINGKKTFKEGL